MNPQSLTKTNGYYDPVNPLRLTLSRGVQDALKSVANNTKTSKSIRDVINSGDPMSEGYASAASQLIGRAKFSHRSEADRIEFELAVEDLNTCLQKQAEMRRAIMKLNAKIQKGEPISSRQLRAVQQAIGDVTSRFATAQVFWTQYYYHTR